MTHARTPEELRAALETQLTLLSDSCGAYDTGRKYEALRIATGVYILVHDGGKKNKLILTQLQLKDALKFIASGHPIDGQNLLADTPLVGIRIYGREKDTESLPRCQLPPGREFSRELSFTAWRERDFIFHHGSFTLTRKKLVYNLRSVEGGAHYDAMVQDPNYLRFTRGDEGKLFVMKGGVTKVLLGTELATMRQIGWEIFDTLKRAAVWG